MTIGAFRGTYTDIYTDQAFRAWTEKKKPDTKIVPDRHNNCVFDPPREAQIDETVPKIGTYPRCKASQ